MTHSRFEADEAKFIEMGEEAARRKEFQGDQATREDEAILWAINELAHLKAALGKLTEGAE